MDRYLKPTYFLNSENCKIRDTSVQLTSNCNTSVEKAVNLFNFVRDKIPYSFYMSSVFEEDFKASRILEWGKGFCVQKAVLLTALSRAAGIPSRLCFACIRNNRLPENVKTINGDNIFERHGYNQFYIDEKWISAVAAFDKNLCEKHQLPVVNFNGKDNAFLPEKDNNGNLYIEYIEYFNPSEDVPFEWVYDILSKKNGTAKRPVFKRKKQQH